MYIGKENSQKVFIDSLGNCENEVIIDDEGFGNFTVKGRSTSVWVEK